MRVSVALVAATAFGLTASASAQQAPYRSGSDSVDALIADIAKGRRAAAIARISSIASMSGKRTLATPPTQFVDRLLGCRPVGEASNVGFAGTKLIAITWSCASVRYFTVFDPDYAKPYITVGELEDEAVRKARFASQVAPAQRPPPTPRAPNPIMAEADRIEVIKTLLSTLISGDFEKARPLIAPDARITLGRRDTVAHVTVTELDGTGADAFVEQGRSMIAKLGKPVSLNCEIASCRFTYARADRLLIAMVGISAGRASYVQFLYAKR